ncbi:MAG TPA: hypothetical protein VNU66_09995 [Mycobacteriales bacterium]|nr:hypothetical protein [Mycobacteriales bacterium]
MHCSVHLLETSPQTAARLLAQRWSRSQPAGLLHAEPMTAMELGTTVVSTRRFRAGRVVLVARWESFDHLDAWLADDPAGRRWAQGWHVRLEPLRRWGRVRGLDDVPEQVQPHDPAEPVVAVTLARLRLPEVPRFVRWGRPVEEQVRDAPGQVLALAAAAPPRTVSTVTVWRSAQAMTDMVTGRSAGPGARRHVEAMAERGRRDFHHEFTTLRFRCLEEHGSWEGRTGIVPTSSGGGGGPVTSL